MRRFLVISTFVLALFIGSVQSQAAKRKPTGKPAVPPPTVTETETEVPALVDRPTADQYTAAKKVVEDLFESELRKANKPEQKAKLAKELLKIADETKGNNAQRHVLLTMARKLATAGRDKATAFDAVIAMANVFKPNEALLSEKSAGKPAEDRYFDEAQGYWGLAEKNRGMKQLEFQVQAAEWYAYALPKLDGVKGLLAEKNLHSCNIKSTVMQTTNARSLAGKWRFRYCPNKCTRTYVISTDGAIYFVEQKLSSKLVFRGTDILLSFGDGKLSRLNLSGNRLYEELYSPTKDFPDSPNQIGVGKRVTE